MPQAQIRKQVIRDKFAITVSHGAVAAVLLLHRDVVMTRLVVNPDSAWLGVGGVTGVPEQ